MLAPLDAQPDVAPAPSHVRGGLKLPPAERPPKYHRPLSGTALTLSRIEPAFSPSPFLGLGHQPSTVSDLAATLETSLKRVETTLKRP